MSIKRFGTEAITEKADSGIYHQNLGSNKEEDFELTLRPSQLDEYVGQGQLKANLKVFIEAAKKRGECLEHMLFYGPPGLGKTTLSMIIAKEMGSDLKTTSGPAIEKAGDLAAIVSNLKEGDILFIDEIHRLKPNIEEILYSAMEDYRLDIVIGKGPGARSMSINLPKFTLIGATTKLSSMSPPLRDRFGNISRLEFYTDSEIEKILSRSSGLLGIDIEKEALSMVSKCCRSTPRIANRILKRLRDFAEVQNNGCLSGSVASSGLVSLGIDSQGLDISDKNFLETIIHKFSGGPVGLSTIAVAISEERETIEEVYEPYLIQLGFIKRTPKGRMVTQRAYEYLGMEERAMEGV